MESGILILAILLFLYGAVGWRLSRWSISMPMVFVAAGFLLGPAATNLLPISPTTEGVKGLAEIALALLLFSDASTLSLRRVREDARTPLRLLSIGLPLTVALGALIAFWLLPEEGLAFAALLAVILAPTDAALGLQIFNNPKVPGRIRRALNVESGLNDGIATPIFSLFLAFAVETDQPQQAWLAIAIGEIALAVVVGILVGVVGGWLLKLSAGRGWTSGWAKQIASLGLALAAYFGSTAIQGNGFIAAFVGGLVFGYIVRGQIAEPVEFTENLGTLFSLLVWVIFGAILVPAALRFTTGWGPIIYAVLSLTVIRMAPVALALIGMRLRADTVAIMGWFGPRGLASVVFTLLALIQFQEASRPVDTLVAAATWTVLFSIVAHGLSAQPLANWYARRLKAASPDLPELVEVSAIHARRHSLGQEAPQ
jgi:NhaP-type Na+/H+ or K+/H+ antiporter